MRISKLAAMVFLLMACMIAKAETPITVLEGRVVSVVGVGAFVLSDSQSTTLVYFRDTAAAELSPGDRLRVIGTLVDDWMGMGEVEIQAQRVERISEKLNAQLASVR